MEVSTLEARLDTLVFSSAGAAGTPAAVPSEVRLQERVITRRKRLQDCKIRRRSKLIPGMAMA